MKKSEIEFAKEKAAEYGMKVENEELAAYRMKKNEKQKKEEIAYVIMLAVLVAACLVGVLVISKHYDNLLESVVVWCLENNATLRECIP